MTNPTPTSNLTNLFAIEDALFVADILSKTRDGGLPWIKLAPDMYALTMCEQSECQTPVTPGYTWTFYIRRCQANDTNTGSNYSYVYYLQVILDGISYIAIDSRATNFVEQLFRTIELTQIPMTHWNIDQAITFISNVPTNPSTPVTNFVMCGGAGTEGFAYVSAHYFPYLYPIYGTKVGGSSAVSVLHTATALPHALSTIIAHATVL